MKIGRNRLFVLLLLSTAALRLIPHPPNFSPMGALGLASGATLGFSGIAYALPLGAKLLGDLIFIGLSGDWRMQPFVYASLALTVVMGHALGGRRSIGRIGAMALASSVQFFLITNLAVWAFLETYPKTPAGLAFCFAAALPYFDNTVGGDMFYSAVLFGGWALIGRGARLAGEPAPAAA